VLLGGTLGTAALGLVLVLLMARAMRLELGRVASAARAIAGGDLDRRVGRVDTFEIAQTASAVDRMAEALKHTSNAYERSSPRRPTSLDRSCILMRASH
jgi:methyl-accepting chemotaxis protein